MKEITITFYVSTKYLRSEVEETVKIEVPEDANEALIDKIVSILKLGYGKILKQAMK